MSDQQKKIQHLYLRAGFGEDPVWVRENIEKPVSWHVNRLFRESNKFSRLEFVKDPTKGGRKKVGAFRLGLLFVKSRKELRKMNLAWIRKMVEDKAQLREKMVFFWHDHFATHLPIAFLMQEQNNLFRKHALGSFRDLLHGVAKDRAMLLYLNNQQNKKGHPNENFAREVMELFTLGEGHYTEQDIKEAARAFTGWQVNRRGEFEIVAAQHDEGQKTVFGKTGNWNGNEIIDLLLEKKRTAEHITEKLWRFLVNDQPEPSKIKELSEEFYASGYQISRLLERIFLDEVFYADENLGALVKSPVELIVHYMRLLKAEYKRDLILLDMQKALGQILFFPPNVSGWPSNTQWIDSSTLMLRMKMPLVLFGLDKLDIELKPELEAMGKDASQKPVPKFFQAEVRWGPLAKTFSGVAKSHLPDAVLQALVQCPTVNVDRQNLLDFADHTDQVTLIKSLCLRVMALPEFQLK